MFNQDVIRERGFSLGQLLFHGGASIASVRFWQAAKCMAAQIFGIASVSSLAGPDFVRQAIAFFVGPAISSGVAGSFRAVRPIAREFLASLV